MRILKISPNTPEWDLLRRNKIGASEAAAICGVDPYTKPEKLWKRKFTGEKQYVSPAMTRGTELEPMARKMLEKSHGVCYTPLVVQHDLHDWMIASLDGYDTMNDVAIEIKCPGEKVFNKIIIEREIPKNYIYQMNHQMEVTGLSQSILVVFNGIYFEEFEIHKDEEIIQEIIAKESSFYESLLEGEFKA